MFERRPFPREHASRLYAIAATRDAVAATVLARTPSPRPERLRADATRPAGLAEWRPAALRPVNIDTNVPATTEKRDKSPRLAPELESSLKRYGSYTELKRAALIIAAAQTDKRSVKKLREEFLKIDTDASGTINEAELCAALGVAELDARISVEITCRAPHAIDAMSRLLDGVDFHADADERGLREARPR